MIDVSDRAVLASAVVELLELLASPAVSGRAPIAVALNKWCVAASLSAPARVPNGTHAAAARARSEGEESVQNAELQSVFRLDDAARSTQPEGGLVCLRTSAVSGEGLPALAAWVEQSLRARVA